MKREENQLGDKPVAHAGLGRRAFLGAGGVLALSALGLFTPWSAPRVLADPSTDSDDDDSNATSAEKQAEADQVEAQLQSWRDQLDIASRNYYLAMEAHDDAVQKMNDAQSQIDAAQSQLDTAQGQLDARAVSMYRSGPLSFLDVLFGATSFEQFTTNWNLLNNINQQTATLVDQTKQAKQAAEDAHAEYSSQEQIAADKLAEADAIQAQAQQTVTDYQNKLDSLEEQIKVLIQKEEEEAREAAVAAAANSGFTGFRGDGQQHYAASVYQTIINAAYSQLGVPYVWGGTTPGVGLDCSGLTQYCYSCGGISIPRVDTTQRAAATSLVPVTDALPGDILWKNGHVALFIGNGQVIEAPYTGAVVWISSNLGRFLCACRW